MVAHARQHSAALQHPRPHRRLLIRLDVLQVLQEGVPEPAPHAVVCVAHDERDFRSGSPAVAVQPPRAEIPHPHHNSAHSAACAKAHHRSQRHECVEGVTVECNKVAVKLHQHHRQRAIHHQSVVLDEHRVHFVLWIHSSRRRRSTSRALLQVPSNAAHAVADSFGHQSRLQHSRVASYPPAFQRPLHQPTVGSEV